MKTKEELDAIKEEVGAVSEKLHGLTDEELEQVVGGLFSRGSQLGGVQADILAGKFGYPNRRPN